AELGVLYWKLNPTIYENDEELNKIREARGYNFMVIFIFYFNSFYFVFCNQITVHGFLPIHSLAPDKISIRSSWIIYALNKYIG
ncbi:hypothetical protein VIGAN_08069000, partial [Vigna angularis var. angularis]